MARRKVNKGYAKLSSAVKRANQRLRELEKHGKIKKESNAYESIRKKAKDGALYLGKTGKGQVKFRTDITRMSEDERKQLEKEVNKFLSAKTSTVSGVKKSRSKGFKTVTEKKKETDALAEEYKSEIMEEMGITEEEYYDIWGSKAVENMGKLLSSSQIQQIILATPKNTSKKEVLDAFKQSYWKNHDFVETIREDFGYSLDKNSNIVTNPVTQEETEEDEKERGKNVIVERLRKGRRK